MTECEGINIGLGVNSQREGWGKKLQETEKVNNEAGVLRTEPTETSVMAIK